MTPAEAVKNPNVQAFLKMLRYGEGTSGPDGYRTIFGGELFDNNYADHPRRAIEKTLGGKPITSTAAGAYQFLARTWTALVKQYGFPDFSPESQDQGAVALIMGRKALPAILAGRFEEAVKLCNREWASLPGSPYGQPTVTMAKALELYTEAGGSLSPATGEKPMAPFLLAALPALFEAVPKLVEALGSGSERSAKNLKAVEAVAEIAKTAVGAVNEQDLVEKLKDPTAVLQVKEAVEANWYSITDTAGTPEARKADAAFVATGAPVYRSPAMLIALALLPLVYLIIGTVAGLWGTEFSADVRSALASSVVSMILGGIAGYYFGTSQSSSRKTELLADK